MATVVPCNKRSIASRLTPALAQSCSTPVITARAGLSGVDGTLSTVIRPSASSTKIKSVNVPPTSTPMRFMIPLLLTTGMTASPRLGYRVVAVIGLMISSPTRAIWSNWPLR